jgi:hypothetical protein
VNDEKVIYFDGILCLFHPSVALIKKCSSFLRQTGNTQDISEPAEDEVLKNEAGAEDTERGSVVGTSNDSNEPIDTSVPSLDRAMQKQRHQGQKVDESERTILEYFLANSNKPP